MDPRGVTDLARPPKEFDPGALPIGLRVHAGKRGTTVDDVLTLALIEYPELELTRPQARELVRYVTAEFDADREASTPTSIETLARLIDKELLLEIDRLAKDNKVLRDILDLPAKKHHRYGMEYISVGDAEMKLATNLDRLMQIQRLINEHRKSDKAEGGSTNNTFNFGGILDDALGRIRLAEANTIDVDAKVLE